VSTWILLLAILATFSGGTVRTGHIEAGQFGAGQFGESRRPGPAALSPGRILWKKDYVRPQSIPFPADNRFSPERALLGRTLFFDPRLSASKILSCARCHNPGFSWGDGLPLAIGDEMKELPRRTPTILNLAWADLLFWDGRAESLEEQALLPIESRTEMNQPVASMIRTVSELAGYRRLFEQAYPGEEISPKTVGRAIAVFERTVVSGRASFDEWIAGNESAIDESAKRGFDLFNAKAACRKCHAGWNFTDDGFHDTGVRGMDKGRGQLLPLEAMQHAFKTPTLRNADQRGPYMHNGSERSLQDVLELYDEGGREKRPSLAPEIVPLHLTAREKADLLAFLKTLTSPGQATEFPLLPH